MKILLLFLLCITWTTPLFAQTINGKIFNAQTGHPLAGAHISIAASTSGTSSNSEGTFTLPKPDAGSYLLKVSQVGYEPQQQLIIVSDSLHTLQVALQPAILELNKTVIVTAKRIESRQFDAPEAISVMTQKQLLQNSPRSTPEALMGLPGVWIQKTNHGGGSPFIRGLTGQQTLIMIDGIRFNNATFRSGPNQYFNTIDPQSIDQIEVLRGSGSVQYGSDALGGVVHVLTKNPEFNSAGSHFTGNAFLKYMSAGMEKSARAELEFGSASFAVLGGIAMRDFGDILAGGNVGRLKPTGYSQLSGDIKAKAKVGSNYLFTAAYQNLRQEDVPVFHKIQLENYALNHFEPQSRQLGYLQAEAFYAHRLFRHVKLTTTLAQSVEGRISQKNNATVLTREKDQVNTRGIILTVNSAPHTNWAAVSGLEYYFDKVYSAREDTDSEKNTTVSKRGLYPDGATASNMALFSLHTFSFGKLNLSAGGRLNGFRITVSENTLGKSVINPTAVVGNLATSYAFHPRHKLIASVNTGFRAPNIDDLGTLGIVDFRYEVPNSNLEPEKSFNMELGLKSSTSTFAGSLALFRNNLTNIISRIRSGSDSVQGYAVYLKENVAEAYIQGIEAEAEMKLVQHVVAYGSFIYTYGQNKTDNEPFRRIPPLNGRLGVSYQHRQLYTRLEYLFAGKQTRLAKGDIDDNRIPAGGTPGWSLLNLNTGYQFKWLAFQAELHNIFNEAYRTHGSGVEGYGRSLWISARVQF